MDEFSFLCRKAGNKESLVEGKQVFWVNVGPKAIGLQE